MFFTLSLRCLTVPALLSFMEDKQLDDQNVDRICEACCTDFAALCVWIIEVPFAVDCTVQKSVLSLFVRNLTRKWNKFTTWRSTSFVAWERPKIYKPVWSLYHSLDFQAAYDCIGVLPTAPNRLCLRDFDWVFRMMTWFQDDVRSQHCVAPPTPTSHRQRHQLIS